MSLPRSQLEAMNPSVLHSLADQVGSVHSALAAQVQSHEQISRNLSDGWRGTSADRAAGDVDDHLVKMRSNAEGVAQLRTALSNGGNELASARSNVRNAVAQLESNGFRVGQDWSVQDASGKKGMRRAYAQREGVSQWRDALTGFDQAEQGAGRATQAALGMIGPVSARAPVSVDKTLGGGAAQFFGGGGGPKGCVPDALKLSDGTSLDSCQVRNAKSVLCAGKSLGMDMSQIKIALTAAWGESELHNLGDAHLGPGGIDPADKYGSTATVQIPDPEHPGNTRTIVEPLDPNNPKDPYWVAMCGPDGVEESAKGYPNKNGIPMLGHRCKADPGSGAGLFQQHPSDGPRDKDGNPPGDWGTTSMVMDPILSATQFYVGYKGAPGLRSNYEQGAFNASNDQAALAESIIRNIQHPNVYKGFYAKHWKQASELFDKLGGVLTGCAEVLSDTNRKKIHDQASLGPNGARPADGHDDQTPHIVGFE